MAKIGVIFMPFSNPICHFRDTADFTHLKADHESVLAHPLQGDHGSNRYADVLSYSITLVDFC